MKLKSLTVKLLIPAIISFLFIVSVFNYMVINKGDKLYKGVVRNTIYEYVESILVAIEVDGSQSNMIRVANSIGAYKDVAEVIIIDREANIITASNRNKLQNKTPEHLFKYYEGILIGDLLNSDKELFFSPAQYEYFLSYPARVLNETKSRKNDILILIHASPRSIINFIGSFKRNFLFISAITFALALIIFHVLIRQVLTKPINRLIQAIEQEKKGNKPKLSHIDSDDELGQLATSFNLMMMEKYNYQKMLEYNNEILEQASNTDPLTSLANRRYFDTMLEDEWNRAMRNGQSIALILADIDYFKKLNDTYGHLFGDDCLKAVATILQDSTKRSGDLAARIGGEEFAIVLPGAKENIWELAERYRREVETHVFKVNSELDIKLTISIGLASAIPKKGQKEKLLIHAADEALYQAKAAGRNRVVINVLNDDKPLFLNRDKSKVIPFNKDC